MINCSDHVHSHACWERRHPGWVGWGEGGGFLSWEALRGNKACRPSVRTVPANDRANEELRAPAGCACMFGQGTISAIFYAVIRALETLPAIILMLVVYAFLGRNFDIRRSGSSSVGGTERVLWVIMAKPFKRGGFYD